MNYMIEFYVEKDLWLTSNAHTFGELFNGRFQIADTDFYRITKFIYIKL